MLYRLLSSIATILLLSGPMIYGMIENKTGHTIILHSFSTHEHALDIAPKELPPYGAIYEAQINFTTCIATTLDGKQCQVIGIELEQSTSITNSSLHPTGKTLEELQAFRKMISKMRRLEPLIIISSRRKIDVRTPITKLN